MMLKKRSILETFLGRIDVTASHELTKNADLIIFAENTG